MKARTTDLLPWMLVALLLVAQFQVSWESLGAGIDSLSAALGQSNLHEGSTWVR